MCEVRKLPLIICSEYIDTISLSGAVKVNNGVNCNHTTFLSKYNTQMTHLNKSLHQYFHLTKNSKPESTIHKEFVPHFVAGGGQPTFPVSKNIVHMLNC
jgi:hypothetical protein